MKKLIPVIALLIGVSGAFGQGVVAFRNDNLTAPPDRLVRGGDMTTALTGTTFAAQLLYGNDPASLQPHPTLAYFRAPTTSSPGTWSGGGRTLATGFGGVGTTIWLQVIAWDAGSARTTTFAEARAQGGLWGQSQVFSYVQALSAPPNPTEDTKMMNFAGFSLVPEPSVIGLGLIGIGALFMLRRRKA
jgi:hypothetical protein